MDTEQVIEIIKATAGSLDSLITQFAYFYAIHAASQWFAVSLPLLILFGVILRMASSLKVSGSSPETVGALVLVAWVMFAVTIYSGVRGTSHILQAAMSPSAYVASEAGNLTDVLKILKKD